MMQTYALKFRWPVTTVALAVIALIGFQTHGERSFAPAEPAVVATVDLERVFNELTALSEAEAELERMAGELKQQGDQRNEKIRLMEDELNTYVAGSKKYQEAIEAYSLESLRLQAFTAFAKQKLDVQMAATFRRIYERIKEAARAESELHGYDLVIVNDAIVQLPESGTEGEMKRQISARRILFAVEEIDITADVVARLNAE